MKNDKPGTSGWRNTNAVILCLSVPVMLVLPVFFISIPGIYIFIVPVLMILFIAVPAVYRKHRDTGRYRRTLIGIRAAFIALAAITLSLPFIETGFVHCRPLYQFKRAVYVYGVSGKNDRCRSMLPANIPPGISGYKCVTQISVPGQNQRASAYLMFFAGSKELRQFESELSTMPDIEVFADITEKEYHGKNRNTVIHCPERFPSHVISQLDTIHADAMSTAQNVRLYTSDGSSCGCLLIHDTGLVILWT